MLLVFSLNFSCFCLRVKSLSKTGPSKKESASSTVNLKESTTVPLSSALLPSSTYEDDTGDSWPEQTDKDDYEEDFYEQEKPSWKKNAKVEVSSFSSLEDKSRRSNGQMKWKEPPKSDTKYSNPDDDLNALLKVKLATAIIHFFTEGLCINLLFPFFLSIAFPRKRKMLSMLTED